MDQSLVVKLKVPPYPPNRNPSLDAMPAQRHTPRMTTALLSNGGPPLDDDDTYTPSWDFGSCAPPP